MHTCAGPDPCDPSYRPKQVLTAEWLNVCKMGKAPFAPFAVAYDAKCLSSPHVA